ncbi:hypothetical protein AB0N09_30860 [Streptomyces erythrochromogenes]|uniref:hypothetical protein n=1 Tax=Streptomyces erythrochromogenes TaxID=285574 RepID=UPI0034453B87
MPYQLQVRMNGELGKNLNRFVGRTGLIRRGRLDDAWDEKFGTRVLRPSEAGLVELILVRWADDTWVIALEYQGDPLPQQETKRLKRIILNAAAEVGMTITSVFPRTGLR